MIWFAGTAWLLEPILREVPSADQRIGEARVLGGTVALGGLLREAEVVVQSRGGVCGREREVKGNDVFAVRGPRTVDLIPPTWETVGSVPEDDNDLVAGRRVACPEVKVSWSKKRHEPSSLRETDLHVSARIRVALKRETGS